MLGVMKELMCLKRTLHSPNSRSPLPEEDVRKLALANRKSCALDPIASAILSVCLNELLPVLPKIVINNLSLETGHFTNYWKCALVHPLLKKCNLEIINKNFRPVRTFAQ